MSSVEDGNPKDSKTKASGASVETGQNYANTQRADLSLLHTYAEATAEPRNETSSSTRHGHRNRNSGARAQNPSSFKQRWGALSKSSKICIGLLGGTAVFAALAGGAYGMGLLFASVAGAGGDLKNFCIETIDSGTITISKIKCTVINAKGIEIEIDTDALRIQLRKIINVLETKNCCVMSKYFGPDVYLCFDRHVSVQQVLKYMEKVSQYSAQDEGQSAEQVGKLEFNFERRQSFDGHMNVCYQMLEHRGKARICILFCYLKRYSSM